VETIATDGYSKRSAKFWSPVTQITTRHFLNDAETLELHHYTRILFSDCMTTASDILAQERETLRLPPNMRPTLYCYRLGSGNVRSMDILNAVAVVPKS
jgi:hypothetical protein